MKEAVRVHGALAVPRGLHRWSLLLVGLAVFGIGVALMVQSNLGLGPWEVFHQGISRHTGLTIGMVSILVGVPVLLGWIPLRQWPGIGTLFNIVLIGLATDATLLVLPAPDALLAQFLLMVAGVLAIGLGSGMYLSARMGAGPRDGLMMGFHERTGISIRLIRTLLEVTVLVVGWLMGGTVGLGTIIFAFGIGPVVQPVMQYFGGLPQLEH